MSTMTQNQTAALRAIHDSAIRPVSTNAGSDERRTAALFDRSLDHLVRDAVRSSRRDPALAYFFLSAALRQRKAARLRRAWREEGVHVNPLMTLNVTRDHGLSVSETELEQALIEARTLGVSVVALAGGEPLTRPELVDMAARFPEIVIIVATDGSPVDDSVLDTLRRNRHIIPVVHLEACENVSDCRRGDWIYAKAVATLDRMRERRLFFGVSITITRPNFALTTSRMFVRRLVERGARLFLYSDYAPVAPGTEHLVPSASQRNSEALTMDLLRREFHAVFLTSQPSERAFGSGMASGDFAHANAETGERCALCTNRESTGSLIDATPRERLIA